jgi:UDP-N-acetylmuramoylalanine--D-glutamate ligase
LFDGVTVSVIGAARSGIAAARALGLLGATVRLSDSQPIDGIDAARLAEIEATGATLIAGATPEEAVPDDTQLVVTSPGVPRKAPVLQEAAARGLPVWSEIELAYRISLAPIVGITGTNGKTTTTVLTAEMLRSAGFDAVIAGNVSADALKRTLVEAAFETRDAAAPANRVLVAEISSFQLEWVERFAPRIGILTNITPDHLNRHSDFEEYAEAKAALFAAQSPDDVAIFNWDDPAARAIGGRDLRGRRLWFTRKTAPPDDGLAAWVEEETVVVRLAHGGGAVPVVALGDLPASLPGAHSVSNVLAAAAAAIALGADPGAAAAAVRGFGGVAHRMEIVREIDGVRYINNSMCTNIAAAVSSLAALDRPAVVIAGGADKALDFAPLAPALRAYARHTILIGSASAKMEAAFRAGGYEAISRAESLAEAVRMARSLAAPGEVVLLSPACASFDMFADFEARGAAFRNEVNALQETNALQERPS